MRSGESRAVLVPAGAYGQPASPTIWPRATLGGAAIAGQACDWRQPVPPGAGWWQAKQARAAVVAGMLPRRDVLDGLARASRATCRTPSPVHSSTRVASSKAARATVASRTGARERQDVQRQQPTKHGEGAPAGQRSAGLLCIMTAAWPSPAPPVESGGAPACSSDQMPRQPAVDRDEADGDEGHAGELARLQALAQDHRRPAARR